MTSVIESLVEMGADINAKNIDGRTPLHAALYQGSMSSATLLIRAGADMSIVDRSNSSPRDLITTPGPFSAEEATNLGLQQRPVKRISRTQNASSSTDHGWSSERLKGYEGYDGCEVDQYRADEITGEELFRNYLSRNAPVLIRGALRDWPVMEKYKQSNLQRLFRQISIEVGEIAYPKNDVNLEYTVMSISKYLALMKNQSLPGAQYPWNWFMDFSIPEMSEQMISPVNRKYLPVPSVIAEAFVAGLNHRYTTALSSGGAEEGGDGRDSAERRSSTADVGGGVEGPQKALVRERTPRASEYRRTNESEDIFKHSQLAIGGRGTGTPFHYHGATCNALVYGARLWYLIPPSHRFMSRRNIRRMLEWDLPFMEHRYGVTYRTCAQLEGDILAIPELWGHGVLNIQDSIAVATSVRHTFLTPTDARVSAT